MKKFILALIAVFALSACSEDNNDDNEIALGALTFKMTQHWDNQEFSVANFDEIIYTNAAGTPQSINRLRYLISNIEFTKTSGEKVSFPNPFIFVDVEEVTNHLSATVPQGDYSAISFVFGFNEEMNVSGAYPELNSASWNWPDMIGGGYHYIQLEGNYLNDIGAPMPYAYHMGSTIDGNEVRDNNHFEVVLNQNFTIDNDTQIEIKMNLAEWFKNPYTWDLNVYNVNLMMNYEAQKLMHNNGKDVFSLGVVQ